MKVLVAPYAIWVRWVKSGGKSATPVVAKAAAVTCLHTVFAVPAHSALVPHVMETPSFSHVFSTKKVAPAFFSLLYIL